MKALIRAVQLLFASAALFSCAPVKTGQESELEGASGGPQCVYMRILEGHTQESVVVYKDLEGKQRDGYVGRGMPVVRQLTKKNASRAASRNRRQLRFRPPPLFSWTNASIAKSRQGHSASLSSDFLRAAW